MENRHIEWCDSCDAPQWVEADGSHKCASISELQERISMLENQVINQAAIDRYEVEKRAWVRDKEEINSYSNSMMLKPFLESVEQYQKEVHCNGKDAIASHNLQSSVDIKMFNKKTGEWVYGCVQWVEASRLGGCGCWSGIRIIAECD
jgi:hypothetical protein